jgi:hypothetical protein
MSLNALQSMERAISSMTLKLFEKKKSGWSPSLKEAGIIKLIIIISILS